MEKAKHLKQLVQDTDQKIQKLQQGPVDVLSRMEALQTQLDEVSDIKDEAEKTARMSILNAEMKSLRESVKQEEQDLAEAVLGLNMIMSDIGGEFNQLTELNGKEREVIARAEKVLAEAQQSREELEDSWNPFFKQRRLDEAETAVKTGEHMVTTARTEADRMMRKRLLSHSLEDSLQEFQVRVEKTITIMKARLIDITGQVNAVSVRKVAAFEAKAVAAGELEIFKGEVEALEIQLVSEESQLMEHPNGSAEYTKQEAIISQVKAQLEDAIGKRNQALAVFQSKEAYATELEVHEVTQKRLQSNQLMWIKTLESDTEESVVTYRSRLEAMKSSSDQEIAQELDKLGAMLQKSNTEFMAKTAVASERLAQEKFESAPKRLEKLLEIQAAQTEALTKAGLNMDRMIQDMVARYGFDPTMTNRATYVD